MESEETPNGVVAVSTEMDLSCSLCAQTYDGGARFPMMICPEQHSCCEQCIHRFVFPLRAKPPQPPDPDQRISTCPFCRTTIHLDAVRKFRVLDELRIALEKAKRQNLQGYSSLQEVTVQLKRQLEDERRIRLNLQHQFQTQRANNRRQMERLRMEAQTHEQTVLSLRRKLREKQAQVEEMEKEFQMREQSYLQQRTRKQNQIEAVKEDKERITEIMRHREQILVQLQESLNHMEEKIIEKERIQIQRELQTRNERKQAWIYRGEQAFRQNKWEEAAKQFMQIIAEFGSNEQFKNDIPQCWGCTEDLKEIAPPYANHFLSISARTISYSIFDMLGVCLAAGDVSQAEQWLKQQFHILKLWQLRLLLAHVYFNSKKYAEAKELYTLIYDLKKPLKLCELLGWTELAIGNNAEAKKWGQIALRNSPNEKSMELLLILVDESVQKMSKLKKLVSQHPNFYRASYELAHLLYKSQLQQDHRYALELLQKVPNGCLLHQGSLLLAGQIHYTHDEYHQALICFSLSVNCSVKAVDGYFWLGNIELKQKRYDLAINCYGLCLENNPNHYEALYNMGMAYLQKNEPQKALQMYLDCKRAKQDYYLAYYGMARVLIKQGDQQTALQEINKCLQYKPGYQYAEKIKKQLMERREQAERTRLRGQHI